nr:SIR2 family protein [Saprospiraceae bacterium]
MDKQTNKSLENGGKQKKVRPKSCVSYDTFIKDIATELAYNYMTVSFGETYKDGYLVAGIDNEEEVKQNIFHDPDALHQTRGDWQKCRNILVIGSGASYDAFRSIPLGKETKAEVLKRLKLLSLLDANQAFSDKFEEEAERILANRMGEIPKKNDKDLSWILDARFDFESFLLLLTHFFREQEIRTVIHDIFNVRHAPSMFYEVMAHLFKHSFIDIIVNFNFDEMLDQSIKEEMGRGSYHEIFSDGHCMDISEIVVDGRLKKPLYIKPHGTISHKSSLRFTKNHYFDLPDDMQVLLSQLLGGQLKSDPNAPRLERVNLITVGFNLESIEFNSIIEANAKRIKLYSIVYDELPRIFDNTSAERKAMKNACERKGEEDNGKLQLLPTAFLKQGDKTPKSLTDISIDLFKKVSDIFNDTYKPRGLERHHLYHDFFYNQQFREKGTCPSIEELKEKFNSQEFFKIRVVLEIGICLACGRGIIELKELMKERLGELYRLYRIYHDKEQLTSLPETLYDLADVFKL